MRYGNGPMIDAAMRLLTPRAASAKATETGAMLLPGGSRSTMWRQQVHPGGDARNCV